MASSARYRVVVFFRYSFCASTTYILQALHYALEKKKK
jgi:hypothetical protein